MFYQFFKRKDSIKNESQKNKKQEGRSMVEMLGVLAIIGVLSIGGISGYTIAMRRYKANEIVNSMNKFATVIYTGFQNKKMNDPNSIRIIDEGLVDFTHYIYDCGKGDYSTDSCISTNDYTDVGLGALPAGVSEIRAERIVSKTDENGNSRAPYWEDSSFSLKSDYVVIFVAFSNDDKELCKTTFDLLNMYPSYSYEGDKEACNHYVWDKAYVLKMIPVD